MCLVKKRRYRSNERMSIKGFRSIYRFCCLQRMEHNRNNLIYIYYLFFFVASLQFIRGGAASRGAPPEPCPAASCLAASPGARAMQPRPKAVAPRGSFRLRPARRPLPLPAVGRYIGARGLPRCPWVPCSPLRGCASDVTALASLALSREVTQAAWQNGGTVIPPCVFHCPIAKYPLNKGSPSVFSHGLRAHARACTRLRRR